MIVDMLNPIATDRLLITPLTRSDTEFILELVNSEGWLKFIGDRNIHTHEDSLGYIQKIIDNPGISYWVVRQKATALPAGIITFIKRDYLAYNDIGFAFLPAFAKMGYAFEATRAVLTTVLQNSGHSHILATTIPENAGSVKLLRKLGLLFDKEIEMDSQKLHVYSASREKLMITEITNLFFEVFTNKNNKQPNWNLLKKICIPETIIIRKTSTEHTVYNLDSFIEPRQKILTDGTLVEFEENEITGQTKIINNIAERHSEYQKSGILAGNFFKQRGHKFFQLIKTDEEWKIVSVVWQDE